jgi:ribulose-5-phosphate 4-epimerase/fuculose-1-phosphate aldolase
MTDLIYNHITARIPGTEHLLINLYGLLYKEITASSLVKIERATSSASPIPITASTFPVM